MEIPFFKIILKNTLAQGSGKFFNLFFSFLTTLILRRTLARSGFGEYVYLLSLVMVFVSLSDFGTHLVGVREASKVKKNQKILANIIFLRLAFSLFISAILCLLSFTPLRLPPEKLVIVIFLLPLLSFRTSLNLFFQTKLHLEKFALIEVIHSLLFLLLVLSGSLLKKNLDFFLLALVFSNFIIMLFFALYFKVLKDLEFKLDKSFLKNFFKESFFMGGILVFFSLYSRLDSILLKFLKGDEAVAIYGLGYKVYENLTLPAAFLMNSYLPLLSREARLLDYQKHLNRFKILLKNSAVFLLISSLFLIFTGYFFSGFIMKLLTGDKAIQETQVLILLLPSLIFAFLNHLTGYSLLAMGQQRKSFLIALLALVFNLTLNLIFIPKFSYVGSAVITVLTEALVLVFSASAMLRFLKTKEVLTS